MCFMWIGNYRVYTTVNKYDSGISILQKIHTTTTTNNKTQSTNNKLTNHPVSTPPAEREKKNKSPNQPPHERTTSPGARLPDPRTSRGRRGRGFRSTEDFQGLRRLPIYFRVLLSPRAPWRPEIPSNESVKGECWRGRRWCRVLRRISGRKKGLKYEFVLRGGRDREVRWQRQGLQIRNKPLDSGVCFPFGSAPLSILGT